jgi:antirestriction protein ArdC
VQTFGGRVYGNQYVSVFDEPNPRSWAKGLPYLAADLATQRELRDTGYIKSWLTVLRNFKKGISAAARQVAAAAEYLKTKTAIVEEVGQQGTA